LNTKTLAVAPVMGQILRAKETMTVMGTERMWQVRFNPYISLSFSLSLSVTVRALCYS
jgi:hypothetical protein